MAKVSVEPNKQNVVAPATVTLQLGLREALYLRYILYTNERMGRDGIYTPLNLALCDHDARLRVRLYEYDNDMSSSDFIEKYQRNTGLKFPE